MKKTLDLKLAGELLPIRDINGNKGTFGRVLLVCGSKNMVGCCVLSAKGALRSGAGLVTLCFPDVLYNSLTAQLNEPLFLPLKTDERGFFSHEGIEAFLNEAEKADVIMLGCGIGTGFVQSLFTTSLLKFDDKPVILDADALNNLAPCVDILKKAKANILVTPHPGEMARLMGCSVADIEADRVKAVKAFASRYGVNVLLKGHETLICNKECAELYVNTTGNTGLSKGGSGDLLSGIIAGLTPAFKGDVFKSAVLGAFVHGMCADVLKDEISEYSILPTDCANVLGKVFKTIEMSGMN